MNIVSPVPVVSGYVFLGLAGSATIEQQLGSQRKAYAEVYVNGTSVPCPGGALRAVPDPELRRLAPRRALGIRLGWASPTSFRWTPPRTADFVDTLTIQGDRAARRQRPEDPPTPRSHADGPEQTDGHLDVTEHRPGGDHLDRPRSTTADHQADDRCRRAAAEVAATYACDRVRGSRHSRLVVKTSARQRSPAKLSKTRQGDSGAPEGRAARRASERVSRKGVRARPRTALGKLRHGARSKKAKKDARRRDTLGAPDLPARAIATDVASACRRRSRRIGAVIAFMPARFERAGSLSQNSRLVFFHAHGALDRQAFSRKGLTASHQRA
jgi:hypothetical protein